MHKDSFIAHIKYDLLDMIQSLQPYFVEMVEDGNDMYLKEYSVLDVSRERLMDYALKVLFGDDWDKWSCTEWNADLEPFCGVVLDSWEYDKSYHAHFSIEQSNDGYGDTLHCVYTKMTPLSRLSVGR